MKWAVSAYIILVLSLLLSTKLYLDFSAGKLVLLSLVLLLITIILCVISLECFKKITPNEINLPASRYFYFETQGTYGNAACKLSSKFDDIKMRVVKRSPSVRFMQLQFEHPDMLKVPEQMRVCWGKDASLFLII